MTCSWTNVPQTAISAIVRHLPLGPAWRMFRAASARGARLLAALAASYDDMSAALSRLVRESDPRTTEDMITEWETAVGLPDPCLPTAATLAERRAWVMWRLTKKRWNTAEDWFDLAALFGLEIAITPGWYVQRKFLFGNESRGFSYFQFPLGFDIYPKLGRFRVYIDVTNVEYAGFEYGAAGVNLPVGFPIPFGETSQRITAFMCLINRVAPANVLIIWNEFPSTDALVCTRRSFDPETFGPPFC